MLEGMRVVLSAYTASFRVPSFIGHQLTLPVPPLSTAYGLLAAALGRWVRPDEVEWLAFRCDYAEKATDLEAITTFERGRPAEIPRPKTRNVMRREFLALPRLTLYLPAGWELPFKRPRYALLLGRTQDVATVDALAPVTLEPVEAGETRGVLLPLELIMHNSASAWLHNLPIALTEEPQRRLLGMRTFGVLDAKRPPALLRAPEWLVRDTSEGAVVPLYRREWILNALQRPLG
jgi:CRISPR-associated protein Cas5t